MKEKIERPYQEVRSEIRDADLLLFRPRGFIWRLVAVAGRSEYTHGAKAGWWNDRLMCVEMTSGGGRAQLLSNLVEQWPGVIDVYEANAGNQVPSYDRKKALGRMIEITGIKYGWANLKKVAFFHIPITRLFVKPPTDDSEKTTDPPFCTHAVADADCEGGADPVPNLANRAVEPGDLSRSTFYRYMFTLGTRPKPMWRKIYDRLASDWSTHCGIAAIRHWLSHRDRKGKK